jgi:translation elongation factor EF-4
MKAMVRGVHTPRSRPTNQQVYAGVFPIDGGEFPKLEEAIERVSMVLHI